MIYLVLKALLTGALVVAISEISKKSSLLAAVLASLPLTSILAFIWIYLDSKDSAAIESLSYGIFWLVIPSLAFFLLLPFLMKTGMHFFLALVLASVSTSFIYWAYAKALSRFGIEV